MRALTDDQQRYRKEVRRRVAAMVFDLERMSENDMGYFTIAEVDRFLTAMTKLAAWAKLTGGNNG